MKTITAPQYLNLTNEQKNNFTGTVIDAINKRTIFTAKNGKLHNTTGPALFFPDGNVSYYIEGVPLTYFEWLKQTKEFKDLLEYKN